jgi:hypothetical protein
MSRIARTGLAALATALLVGVSACGGSDGGEGADAGTTVAPQPPPPPANGNGGGDGDDDDGDDGGGGTPTASTQVSVGPAFASAPQFDFGEQAVGSSTTLSVSVTNILATPIVAQGVSMGGDHPDNFPVESTTCEAGVEIPAQGSCEVIVVFRPSAPGEREGVLSINVTGAFGRQLLLLGVGSE